MKDYQFEDFARKSLALLTEIRDRLPKPEVTEEPPVGTYLVDPDDDVWVRREGGWTDWTSRTSLWRTSLIPWRSALGCGPFRLATPADLARVGIEGDGLTALMEHFGVKPTPADDRPGEPVEPGDLRAGDRVAFTWRADGERTACTLMGTPFGTTLYSDTPRSTGFTPYVVSGGEWCYGISDVRLIERAPHPDEALAKVIYAAEGEGEDDDGEWDDLQESVQDDFRRMARAAREHIEAEMDKCYAKEDATAHDRADRAEGLHGALRADVENELALAEVGLPSTTALKRLIARDDARGHIYAEPDQSWVTRDIEEAEEHYRVECERAEKLEADLARVNERLEALRGDVADRHRGANSILIRGELRGILDREDERAKGEQR